MRALLAFAATAALILAACGGDNGDDTESGGDGPSGTEEPVMSTAGPALTDTEYVAALCDGAEGYMDAINTKGEEELRAARDELEATTRALHPPGETEGFHRDYVAYLETAEDDPTLLLVTAPPLPEGPLLARLAAAEAGAGCKYPFFTRTDLASPTPGG